ncbi:MAG: hypothetical protein QM660_12725 [Dysgonomonas sp.]
MNIFFENLNEIDTSEAFFGTILFNNNSIVIPYINLGISNHILNLANHLKYVDYSYFVGTDIYYLKINQSIIINDLLNIDIDISESTYLGGMSIGETDSLYDIEIKAKIIFLQVKDNYRLTEITNMWIPVDCPNIKANMDPNKVNDFINNRNLPENIKKIILN